MTRRTGRRMGWIGGTALALLVLVLLAGGAAAWAYRNHPVALLDFVDRSFRGNRAVRLVGAPQDGADPAQKVEVFAPVDHRSAPLPIVVFIHGGGWDSGD